MWEIDLYGIWDWLTEQDEATVAGVYAALDVLEREGRHWADLSWTPYDIPTSPL